MPRQGMQAGTACMQGVRETRGVLQEIKAVLRVRVDAFFQRCISAAASHVWQVAAWLCSRGHCTARIAVQCSAPGTTWPSLGSLGGSVQLLFFPSSCAVPWAFVPAGCDGMKGADLGDSTHPSLIPWGNACRGWPCRGCRVLGQCCQPRISKLPGLG